MCLEPMVHPLQVIQTAAGGVAELEVLQQPPHLLVKAILPIYTVLDICRNLAHIPLHGYRGLLELQVPFGDGLVCRVLSNDGLFFRKPVHPPVPSEHALEVVAG